VLLLIIPIILQGLEDKLFLQACFQQILIHSQEICNLDHSVLPKDSCFNQTSIDSAARLPIHFSGNRLRGKSSKQGWLSLERPHYLENKNLSPQHWIFEHIFCSSQFVSSFSFSFVTSFHNKILAYLYMTKGMNFANTIKITVIVWN